MPAKLYVVGTPIGNLSDLSLRAAKTLEVVDFIAAEDSRVTLKLLNNLNIKKKVISYFEHNKYEKSKFICEKILNGENCALVSDAGMPCISDPGEYLVQMCFDLNIEVTVIPGPCAVSSALSLAGIFGNRFSFEGFLSVNKKSRNEHLKQIQNETKTMVFYEAPHKLYKTLCDLFKVLGNRNIVLVKELTKIHECAIHTSLECAVSEYKDKNIKGEYVIIVKSEKKVIEKKDNGSLEIAIKLYEKFISLGYSKTDAIKKASAEADVKKNMIYRYILKN